MIRYYYKKTYLPLRRRIIIKNNIQRNYHHHFNRNVHTCTTDVSVEELQILLAEHGAVSFRSMNLQAANQFEDLVKHFGNKKPLVPVNEQGACVQLYNTKGRKIISSSKETQKPSQPRGSDHWHSDNSYNDKPAAATALYAVGLPLVKYNDGRTATVPGIGTWLCDGANAYDALPLDLKNGILNLYAEHSSTHNGGYGMENNDLMTIMKDPAHFNEISTEEDKSYKAIHPVIREHPHSKRLSIYVNPCYTTRLILPDGKTPVNLDVSNQLLTRLYNHMFGHNWHVFLESSNNSNNTTTNNNNNNNNIEEEYEHSPFCEFFQWNNPGDMLIWDNMRMLHRATTLDMPDTMERRMLRASIQGDVPYFNGDDNNKHNNNVVNESSAINTTIPANHDVFNMFETLYSTNENDDTTKNNHLKESDAPSSPPPTTTTTTSTTIEKTKKTKMQTISIIEILKNDLNFTSKEIKQMEKKCPELSLSIVDDASQIEIHDTYDYLKTIFKQTNKMKAILKRSPELLFYTVQELQHTYDYLHDLTTITYDTPNFKWDTLLAASPRILTENTKDLNQKIELFQQYDVNILAIIKGHLPVFLKDTDILMRMFDFLEFVGFDKAQCGDLVSSFPTLLTYDPDTQVKPLVDYLKANHIDPTSKLCKGLFAWPNPEKWIQKNIEFLTSYHGGLYNEKLLFLNPIILCYSFEQRVEPRVKFALHLLEHQHINKMPHAKALTTMEDPQFVVEVGSNVETYRRFIQDYKAGEIDLNIEKVFQFLIEKVKINPYQEENKSDATSSSSSKEETIITPGMDSRNNNVIFKMCCIKHPELLKADVENTLFPAFDWLRRLGIRDKSWRQPVSVEQRLANIVEVYPEFLTRSVENELKPLGNVICKHCNILERQLGMIFEDAPLLLLCNEETIINSYNWFVIEKKIDREFTTKMVEKWPKVLSFTPEQLNHSVDVLINEYNIPEENVMDMIGTKPKLLLAGGDQLSSSEKFFMKRMVEQMCL